MTSACHHGYVTAAQLTTDLHRTRPVRVSTSPTPSVRLLSAAPGRNDAQSPPGGASLPLNRTQADSPAPLPAAETRAARAGGVGNAQQCRSVVSAASCSSVSVSPVGSSAERRLPAARSKATEPRPHGRTDTVGSAAGQSVSARLGFSFLCRGGKTRTEARSVRPASRRPPARTPALPPEYGRIHRQFG